MPLFRVWELSSFQIYKVLKNILYIFIFISRHSAYFCSWSFPFFSLFTLLLLKSNTNGSSNTRFCSLFKMEIRLEKAFSHAILGHTSNSALPLGQFLWKTQPKASGKPNQCLQQKKFKILWPIYHFLL